MPHLVLRAFRCMNGREPATGRATHFVKLVDPQAALWLILAPQIPEPTPAPKSFQILINCLTHLMSLSSLEGVSAGLYSPCVHGVIYFARASLFFQEVSSATVP